MRVMAQAVSAQLVPTECVACWFRGMLSCGAYGPRLTPLWSALGEVILAATASVS